MKLNPSHPEDTLEPTEPQDAPQDAPHIPATLQALAVPVSSLSFYPGNARRGDVPRIKKSLRRFGQYRPITARLHSGVVICGNHTLQGATELGWDEVAVTFVDVSDDEAARIVLTDNALSDAAENDAEAMAAMLEGIPDWRETIPGLEDYEVADLTGSTETKPQGNLADMFGAPPFSVLDARQGSWKERKDAWKALGIQSELGRDGALVFESPQTMYRNWYEVKNAAVAAEGRKMADKEILASVWAGRLERMNDGGGTSIFDPVLTELMYRWFAPAGGRVLDPWAGGSVRGIVASRLGRSYTGIELRGEQVEANRAQVHLTQKPAPGFLQGPAPVDEVVGYSGPGDLTPVETHGGYLVKRDDLFAVGGSRGGKVRTCRLLAERAKAAGAHTLVTAGSRQSPQVNIVATLAAELGMACRVHVPAGELTPELRAARAAGAELVQHKAGYNNVIVARAREDAKQNPGVYEIPFGMECNEAVEMTATQVASLGALEGVKRIVIPVGSGMSAAGVLAGLRAQGIDLPVLGVQVGADPRARLNTYAPGWKQTLTLVKSPLDYHAHAPEVSLGALQLDPVYEAKCLPFLQEGDLLWVVGRRETAAPAEFVPGPEPVWIEGESTEQLTALYEAGQGGTFDMIIGCPPYYDLETYSDDPRDLSNMGKAEFDQAMFRNVAAAARLLAADSYAVFVVGGVRDKKGALMDMRSLMIAAAADAGMVLHNDAILLTPVGSIRLHAAKQFVAARTLSRTHQDVLVFLKGDKKRAAGRMSLEETQATLETLEGGDDNGGDS